MDHNDIINKIETEQIKKLIRLINDENSMLKEEMLQFSATINSLVEKLNALLRECDS